MKNAKWILICLSALSLQAQALDFSKLVHIKKSLTGNPPTPIRTAKVRVTILKETLTKNPQGGYDSTEEQVCTRVGTVNVYDLRPSNDIIMGPDDVDRANCPSTVGGAATTVHIGGVVGLGNSSIFGSPEDFKLAATILYYDSPGAPPGNINVDAAAFGVGGSMDLNAKSMVSIVSQMPPGVSTTPAPINEYFQAIIDSED